jgi:hypothetical protein
MEWLRHSSEPALAAEVGQEAEVDECAKTRHLNRLTQCELFIVLADGNGFCLPS